jgi:hypothetical protein
MSIIFPDTQNRDVVMYTDGVSFTQSNTVFNLGFAVDSLNSTTKLTNNKMFYISEGIWYFPFEFRLCIYTADEIINNSFLDITNKITVYSNTFLYLEKEIEVPPFIKGMEPEYYYDATFCKEKDVVNLLRNNMDLYYKGNLTYWKNSIEMIDYIFA